MFAELSIQARVETMIVLRIIGMPELKEFFGNRVMTPSREPWMTNVDVMRRIMRWGDASIGEFDTLTTAGESLILSARLAPFAPSQMDPEPARDWAFEFRNEVMQYVQSYRTVTGVDLSEVPGAGREVDATQPSVYLAQREREYERGLTR